MVRSGNLQINVSNMQHILNDFYKGVEIAKPISITMKALYLGQLLLFKV